MAVYTKISQQEIINHLKNYSIKELVNYHEIIEGIDNSNFILQTTDGKFILTIFEKRINENDLPFFINFKLHLAQKGINCPCPIIDKSGSIINKIANKNSVIVSFLSGKTLVADNEGYYDSIKIIHCQEIGKILAKMHLSAIDLKLKRHNDLGINNFLELFKKFSHLLEGYQLGLASEILQNIEFLQKAWFNCDIKNLTSAPAHLDLFPDNVFFENDKLSGVIDFYFSANEILIYDLAIAVNAWCFDKLYFNQQKFTALIDSYKKIRDINKNEEQFLEIALFGASMRFLLTRLNDMFFTDKNSLVKIKDPMEYLYKSRFFKNKIINKL